MRDGRSATGRGATGHNGPAPRGAAFAWPAPPLVAPRMATRQLWAENARAPRGEPGEAAPSAPATPCAIAGGFPFARAVDPFETDSIQAVGRHFSELNREPAQFRVDAERAFVRFRHARVWLARTSLDYFQIQCPVAHEVASTRPLDSEFIIFVPYRGVMQVTQGRRHAEVGPGQIGVISPAGCPTRKRFSEPAELLCILVDRQTVMKTIADEYGINPGIAPVFEPQLVADIDKVPTLWNFIQMLMRDLDQPRSCIDDPVTARACERMLVLLTLQSFPHDFSERLAGPRSAASPFYVRRVQEYVRANATKAITAADLAAASGVSARAVYYGFRQYLGVSPMKYLKQVRLDGARAALRRTQGMRGAVTGIALTAGYDSLSRFCRDYRARFGETPSETARRG